MACKQKSSIWIIFLRVTRSAHVLINLIPLFTQGRGSLVLEEFIQIFGFPSKEETLTHLKLKLCDKLLFLARKCIQGQATYCYNMVQVNTKGPPPGKNQRSCQG